MQNQKPIPDYNKIDYDNDDLNVIDAKEKAIQKQREQEAVEAMTQQLKAE